jgi:hypothetical protein
VFPVRYELDIYTYIIFIRNSVFKGLSHSAHKIYAKKFNELLVKVKKKLKRKGKDGTNKHRKERKGKEAKMKGRGIYT